MSETLEENGENRSLPPKTFMIMGRLPDYDETVCAIRTQKDKPSPVTRDFNTADCGQTVYFEPRDVQGLHTPHSDPLVVELNIHNLNVPRILIDTGSNVNLIFAETLKKMEIDEDDVKPSAKPL